MLKFVLYTWLEAAKAAWALTPGPLIDSCLLGNMDEYERARFRTDPKFRRFMRLWMAIGLVPIYAFIPVMWALWRTLAQYAAQVGAIMEAIR